MKKIRRMVFSWRSAGLLAAVLVAVLAVMLVFPVSAQTLGVEFLQLPWATIDDGGGSASGGTFSLTGTIGQPEAGKDLSGGSYAVSGGFWQKGMFYYHTFLPLVKR